ncbi:hypothetical protein NQ314_012883 [Rhamnusium bicolor]|uniref:Uncharacterized protein n=1 Tax=Rhamnusium bicolor TaxID=1586634 RepID=A0AAV8X908_9CUCU|nr:hypothetical protein NQ314_012883 [Rhamnusium bicolor]
MQYRLITLNNKNILIQYTQDCISVTDIMNNLIKIQKRFPGLSKVWAGPRLIFLVAEPQHIERVLTNQKSMDKDYFYKFLSIVIGTGLMTAPGK